MQAMEDVRERRRRMTKAALIAEIEALERGSTVEDRPRRATRNAETEKSTDLEIFFRSFIDHSPFEVLIKDREGRYVLANRTWLDWVGLEQRNVLGKTAYDIHSKEVAEQIAAEDERVFKTGNPSRVERELKSWKKPLLVSVIRFPIRDDRGEITAIGMIGIDITEQKEMETELHESEARFRAFVEHAPSEIVVKDLEGRYLVSAPKWMTLVGRTRADVIGKTTRDVFPEDFAAEVERRDRLVLETGATIEAEKTFITEKGARTFTMTKFPIRDARGEIIAIGAISTDITKHKKVEATLKESEERFHDFALSAADWFWETGPDLRITYVSERLFQMVPLSRDDVLGKTFEELASADPENPGWRQYLDKVRHMQSYRDFEFSLPLPDGTVHCVRKSGKSFFDEAGAFKGYRGTCTDVTETVEAERKVASAETRLVEAIEHVPAGIALYDGEDRLVLCNGEYRNRQPGFEPKVGELFERNMRGVIEAGGFHASTGEPEQWLAERLSYHRSAPSYHEQHLPDGRWLSVREYRTREGGVLVLGVDITGHKRAAQTLEESEARFRAFVEHSPSGLFIKDKKLRYLLFDKKSARRLGISNRDAIGKTARAIFPKHLGDKYEALDRAILKSKKAVEVETTVFDKGKPQTLLLHKFPILGEGGEVIAIGSIGTDITGRKQTEAALRESEARFRDLVEGSVQGMVIDRRFKPLFVNRTWAKMHGYTVKEILRMKSLVPVFAPWERTRIRGLDIARRKRQPAPLRYEYQAVKKDGSLIWLENVVRKVTWQGEPAIQSTSIDITERKRTAERNRVQLALMAHCSRVGMVGELTTSLAHELNQPLASLIIYLRGCIRRARAKETEARQLAPVLEKAAGQAERMDAIIRNLRAFVRRHKPVRKRVDVNAAIRDALELESDEARRLGVVVRTRLSQGLPPVRADRVQIGQVVLNLVRNGMEAVQEKGSRARLVEVRSRRAADGAVAIEVRDRGPGIPGRNIERVFEPFFTTKAEGLGMGLAISRWIAEDYGGKISVASSRRSGTAFRVSLPAAGRFAR